MLRLLGASVLAVVLSVPPNQVGPCMGLEKPVEGPLLAGFAPTGRFSGHWGVDWAVPKGTEIRSAGPGTVTFAGSVAGNQAVTVDHGGGLRTSYSYLAGLSVERGDRVIGSMILGTSGAAHGTAALHFSVRIGDTYLDPLAVVGCRWAAPSAALRLVPVRELK